MLGSNFGKKLVGKKKSKFKPMFSPGGTARKPTPGKSPGGNSLGLKAKTPSSLRGQRSTPSSKKNAAVKTARSPASSLPSDMASNAPTAASTPSTVGPGRHSGTTTPRDPSTELLSSPRKAVTSPLTTPSSTSTPIPEHLDGVGSKIKPFRAESKSNEISELTPFSSRLSASSTASIGRVERESKNGAADADSAPQIYGGAPNSMDKQADQSSSRVGRDRSPSGSPEHVGTASVSVTVGGQPGGSREDRLALSVDSRVDADSRGGANKDVHNTNVEGGLDSGETTTKRRRSGSTSMRELVETRKRNRQASLGIESLDTQASGSRSASVKATRSKSFAASRAEKQAATSQTPELRDRRKRLLMQEIDPKEMSLREVIKYCRGGKPMSKDAQQLQDPAIDQRNNRNGDGQGEKAQGSGESHGSGGSSGAGDASKTQTSADSAPQVQLTEDGQLIINEDALFVIDTDTADRDRESLSRVDESGAFITSRSFTNWAPNDRWSPEDTTKFYKCIRMYGCDFTLLGKMFPERTRRQLRNKFKREEKMNPQRIENALSNRTTMSSEVYETLMGKSMPSSDDIISLRATPTAEVVEPPTAVVESSAVQAAGEQVPDSAVQAAGEQVPGETANHSTATSSSGSSANVTSGYPTRIAPQVTSSSDMVSKFPRLGGS